MDLPASNSLIYGIVSLVVAGGFLYMTRRTGVFAGIGSTTYSIGSRLPNLSTLQRVGRVVGILIPFALIAVGPLLDLYYNNFRYTTVSLVGLTSIVIGFIIQTIVRGTTAYLSSFTIGTSAILTYFVFDVWNQSDTYNYKVLSTVLGVLLMFLQLVHTTSAPVFATSLMNDLVGTLMGSGLGIIAWVILWNHQRNCLPNSVAVKS